MLIQINYLGSQRLGTLEGLISTLSQHVFRRTTRFRLSTWGPRASKMGSDVVIPAVSASLAIISNRLFFCFVSCNINYVMLILWSKAENWNVSWHYWSGLFVRLFVLNRIKNQTNKYWIVKSIFYLCAFSDYTVGSFTSADYILIKMVSKKKKK